MKKIKYIFLVCLVFAAPAFSAGFPTAPTQVVRGIRPPPRNTQTAATNGVADSLNLGTNGGRVSSSSPQYEDVISGLGPEKKPDEFCDSADCNNFVAICESAPDGEPNSITVTKYDPGDCIGRGNVMGLGSYVDFMANTKKSDVQEVNGRYVTLYKIIQSKDINGNWENIYDNTIDYAAVRISNFSSDSDGLLEKK